MPHDAIRSKIFSAIDAGRLPHALLLCGPEGCGRNALALQAAARYATGDENSDPKKCFDILLMTENVPSPENIRNMEQELAKRPFGGKGRVIVITDAQRMTAQAQNTLLKTIEEPPPNTIFMLTGLESGFLSTIRSRCAIIRMGYEDMEDIAARLVKDGVAPQRARLAAGISGGVYDGAAELDDAAMAIRQSAMEFLAIVFDRSAPSRKISEIVGSKKDDGKRRARLAVGFMLTALADMLRYSAQLPPLYNPDLYQVLGEGAKRFTSAQITCMIDVLSDALLRIDKNMSVSRCLDRVMVALIEITEA